jgi:hypothetical protein
LPANQSGTTLRLQVAVQAERRDWARSMRKTPSSKQFMMQEAARICKSNAQSKKKRGFRPAMEAVLRTAYGS